MAQFAQFAEDPAAAVVASGGGNSILFPRQPSAGILTPEDQAMVKRNILLHLAAGLLQSGGRSPNQQGTLANIGSALAGIDLPGATQSALRMRQVTQEMQDRARVRQTFEGLQAKYGNIADPIERMRAVLGELATMPEGQHLVGPLSNALQVLQTGTQGRWSIMPQLGTDDKGNPVMLERNSVTGETRVAKGPDGKPIRAYAAEHRAEQQDFTRANQMYGRWQSDTRDHKDIALNYNAVLSASADPSPAGDLSLIFAYMKMLDPGSVVREGEFATAANTGSVPERIRAQYNKVISGERLTEGQRADFLNQAKARAASTHRALLQLRDTYGRRAQKYGLDVDDVTTDYFGDLLGPRAPAAAGAGPSSGPAAPGGNWKDHLPAGSRVP